MYTKFFVGKPEGKNHVEELRVDGGYVLSKKGAKVWSGFIWLRIGTRVGPM
jgi:hypothetical protein